GDRGEHPGERAGEHHPLHAQVEHPCAFGDRFPASGQQQRDGEGDSAGENLGEHGDVHARTSSVSSSAGLRTTAPLSRPSSPASSPASWWSARADRFAGFAVLVLQAAPAMRMISTDCTTVTVEAGTPAASWRLMPPETRKPNSTDTPITAVIEPRASNPTTSPLKPKPEENPSASTNGVEATS